MEKVKQYCHKNDCSVVVTGFHHEQYPVCTVCHLEISESLKKNIEDRNTRSKEREIELEDILGMPDDYFDGT